MKYTDLKGMTLDEIAIVRAEYETESLKVVRKDGNPPSKLKWSYPLRAKSKRNSPAPKPSRSRRTSAFSDAWQIGTEPASSTWSSSKEEKAAWRAQLAGRLPKRLTPERLAEQCRIQVSNQAMTKTDLGKMAELCAKLGGGTSLQSEIRNLIV